MTDTNHRGAERSSIRAAAVVVAAVVSGAGCAPGSAGGVEMVKLAYMGPGAGIAAVGALLAIGWLGLQTIVGLVWYPARKARQWLRARRANSADAAD